MPSDWGPSDRATATAGTCSVTSDGRIFEVQVLNELAALADSQSRIEKALKVALVSQTLSSSPSKQQLHSPSAAHKGSPLHLLGIVGGGEFQMSSASPVHRQDSARLSTGRESMQRSSTKTRTVTPLMTPLSSRCVHDMWHVPAALPDRWPATLALRDGFEKDGARTPSTRTTNALAVTSRQSEESKDTATAKRRSQTVVDPHSYFRFMLDMVGLVVILYDLIMIPLTAVWDVGVDKQRWVIQTLVDIFWLCEMVVNFFTTHEKEGDIENQLLTVARHYLCHGFIIDLSLVICSFLNTLLIEPHTFSGLDSIESHKVGVILRFATLLRVSRLSWYFEALNDRCVTERCNLWLSALAILSSILYAMHVGCCGWYAIGRGGTSDTGLHWVEAQDVKAADSSGWYQYWTSYHFAIAQLTLGGCDVIPQNSRERIYNVACLLTGLLISTTVVSMLSSAMIELQINRRDHKQKLRVLKQFLVQRTVDSTICLRVQKQVMNRMHLKRRLTLDEVPALQMLSLSLKSELNYALFQPHLIKNSLFNLWDSMAPDMFKKLVDKAASARLLMAEDDLFVPAVLAESAYCVMQGQVDYIQDVDHALVDTEITLQVYNGDWLAEMALWVRWLHVGHAQARTQCDLITINPDHLAHILSKECLVTTLTREYGRLYHRQIIGARPADDHLPSDLMTPFCDISDLIPSMSSDLQVAIGSHFLNLWHSKHRWLWGAVEQLRHEVEEGKSTILLSQCGELERIVSVTVIRLENATGEVLTQLGSLNDGEFRVDVKIPGGKQNRGESPNDAVHRLMAQKLGPLVESIEIVKQNREVKSTQSERYTIRTKYVRTTFTTRICNGGGSLASMETKRSQVGCGDASQMVSVDWDTKQMYENSQYVFAWLEPEELAFMVSGKGTATLANRMSRSSIIQPLAPPVSTCLRTESASGSVTMAQMDGSSISDGIHPRLPDAITDVCTWAKSMPSSYQAKYIEAYL